MAISNAADKRETRPALFLDRDGVINRDHGYVARIEDFEWIDGAAEAISTFNRRNWWVFLVTNQSGIARGYYTEEDMHALHAWMRARLAEQDAYLDEVYYCPYHAEGEIARYRKDSFDRKPKPGMLLRAMTEFSVDKARSFMIGDHQKDVDAAKAAGVPGFLFRGGNLHTFAEWALADLEGGR